MKDTRGYWSGDYWGAISIGYNANLVKNAAEDVAGPAQARVQGQGRAERQPADVGLGGRGRLRRGARQRRLAQQRRPGIDFFAKLKQVGQLHPGAVDAADGRIGPDADLDRLGLPEPRLHEGVPGGEVEDDRSRPTASTARYYCQAINATAPHPWAARLWQEFLYSDQGQLLWLKGYSHPARFRTWRGGR